MQTLGGGAVETPQHIGVAVYSPLWSPGTVSDGSESGRTDAELCDRDHRGGDEFGADVLRLAGTLTAPSATVVGRKDPTADNVWYVQILFLSRSLEPSSCCGTSGRIHRPEPRGSRTHRRATATQLAVTRTCPFQELLEPIP